MLGKGLESLIPPSDESSSSAKAMEDASKDVSQGPNNKEKTIPPVITPAPSQTSAPASEPIYPEVAPNLPVSNPVPEAVSPVAPPSVSVPTSIFSTPSPEREAQARAERGGQLSIFQIETEKIAPNPHQPRKDFDEENLKELAQSIREFGILQPLVVTKVERETPNGIQVSYELIAGERRLKAAKSLGLPRVPAIIRTVDTERDRLEMAVIENIQRENLNPIEMARAFARLQDEFRLTQREIASRLGKSREVVANTLRLLDLPSYIQEAVSKGEVSESHARLLLAVTDPEAQEKLFRDLLDRHFTTRELRVRIAARKPVEPAPPSLQQQTLSPEFLALEEKLSVELGTPVKIAQSENGGKITILFYSPEELKGILNRLGAKEE